MFLWGVGGGGLGTFLEMEGERFLHGLIYKYLEFYKLEKRYYKIDSLYTTSSSYQCCVFWARNAKMGEKTIFGLIFVFFFESKIGFLAHFSALFWHFSRRSLSFSLTFFLFPRAENTVSRARF